MLRFTPDDEQTWGLNFERVIKRKNELVYWSGWDRNYLFTDVSQAGHLSGLTGIRQAERIRFRPYVVAGAERLDAVSVPVGSEMIGEIGIDDVKFAVTSNLTADVAVNPDFAQTEVDDQRVNLTRFSLFFPERRSFFIEGADSLRMRVSMLHFGPPPLELFYSRRIGLSDRGEPASIVAGGKLTGKVRGFDLGVLNVQTGDSGDQAGQNYGAARVRKELFGRSYVGAIVTSREGGGASNRVAAADARFVVKEHLNIGALVGRSFDPGVDGEQWVGHVAAEWRSDLIDGGATYLDIRPNFNPGIGFVRRHERMTGGRVSLKPRPGAEWIRQLEFTPSLVYFQDDENIVRSRRALKRFSNRPCTTWGGRGTSARTDAGGPMRAYSMDRRERALLDSDAGMKAAEVAAKYRVSGSWVRLLKQRRRDTGEVAPRVQRHGRRGMLEPHLHTLAALIAAQPDRTLAELKDALATPASVPTVWRAVRALGLTVKKHGPPVRTRSA